MADPRAVLIVFLIIAFVFFAPNANLRPPDRDRRPRIEDATSEERRMLAVLTNSGYAHLDSLGQRTGSNGTLLGLAGFGPGRNYSWNALPKVKDRAKAHLSYAFGDWGPLALQGETSEPRPHQIYSNVTGYAHGRWVRSDIQYQVEAPKLNLSSYIPIGSFGSLSSHGFERNFSGDGGDVRFGIRDMQRPSRSGGNVTEMSMELTLSEDKTEQEELLILRGVSFTNLGQSVLTTASDKFAGTFAIPHFTLSDHTFDLSRAFLNETISRNIAHHENNRAGALRPWTVQAASVANEPYATPKCELIVYLQQLPPLESSIPRPPLVFFDEELRFPTGAITPAPPDLRFSMLMFSPDCGYVLESKGPPVFPSQQGNHISGPKSEVLKHRARNHMLCYGIIVLLQLILLLRQMREACTPSTRSRVSFFTVAAMVFGDAFATASFVTASAMSESVWVTILSTAFFSLVSMLLFGMRFLSDIWSVHAPERRRQERETFEELRRRRETETASTRPEGERPTTAPAPGLAQASMPPAIPPASQSLPLPVTASRLFDSGATPVFMPSDQAALQSIEPQAAGENESRVPTLGLMYIRFSFSLILTLFLSISAVSYPSSLRRAYFTLLALAYLSFWLPQIARNVQRNCRRALQWEYVLGQSALRLLPMAYFFGWDGNVLFATPHPGSLAAMAIWIWLQVALLASQEIVGPRWFVKASWAPPAWDYHPILRSDLEGSTLPLGLADSASVPMSPSLERVNSTPGTAWSPSVAKETRGRGKRMFDCAICVQDLEVPVVEAGEAGESAAALSGALMLARRSYMVTPCRHIFHSNCLEGWMKYRLQSPGPRHREPRGRACYLAAIVAQPSYDQAYGATPPAAKGSWFSRVSHRASHIPNRPPTGNSGSTSRETLPLRNAGLPSQQSGGLLLGSSERLQTTLRLSGSQASPSSPVSPASPTESDFGTTPIDTTFGDRVENPPERQPAERMALPAQLGRSGMPQQVDLGRGTGTAQSDKMDKYSKQAGDHSYDSDADADDECERSMIDSPSLPKEFIDDQSDHPSESDEEQDSIDGDDTPTTQGWADKALHSPVGSVLQWTEDQVADYISSLSPQLKQYGRAIMEHGITGDALIALNHDDLRELGVGSVGHRLTILKAVYEQKMRSGVKIQEGDYIPLSAEGDRGDLTATQDDIARVIESIRLRDQRIIAAEAELRAMKQDFDRIIDENRRLREETLPVLRLMKDQRTPLPDPSGGTIPSPRDLDPSKMNESMPLPAGKENKGSSLSRKFSTKKLFLGGAPKQPSPTHPPMHTPSTAREVRDDASAHLEASAAAIAASSHLTASVNNQPSPSGLQSLPLSPSSPAYSNQPSSGGSYHSTATAPGRSFVRQPYDEPGSAHSSTWSNASTVVDQPLASARREDRRRAQAPAPSPREDEAPPGSARERDKGDRDNPQVEIFKSFRVSIEDPCEVVLPVALKRYNIHDDWRQYSLYIVHGDQERCLGLKEKPLLLFKQLDKEGRKPMFMLRRHASPQDGWSGSVNGGEKQIPGGVL